MIILKAMEDREIFAIKISKMMLDMWVVLAANKTKSFATYYDGLTAHIGEKLQTKFVDAFV